MIPLLMTGILTLTCAVPLNNYYSSNQQMYPYHTYNNRTNWNVVGSNPINLRDNSGIECVQSGFFVHPMNCSQFYRCVDLLSNTGYRYFSKFNFECGKGYVFFETTASCIPGRCPYTGSSSTPGQGTVVGQTGGQDVIGIPDLGGSQGPLIPTIPDLGIPLIPPTVQLNPIIPTNEEDPLISSGGSENPLGPPGGSFPIHNPPVIDAQINGSPAPPSSGSTSSSQGTLNIQMPLWFKDAPWWFKTPPSWFHQPPAWFNAPPSTILTEEITLDTNEPGEPHLDVVTGATSNEYTKNVLPNSNVSVEGWEHILVNDNKTIKIHIPIHIVQQ